MTARLRAWSDDETVLLLRALEDAEEVLRRVAATVEALLISDRWQPGMARRRRMARDVARCRTALCQLCDDLGHRPLTATRLPLWAVRQLQGDGTPPPPAPPYAGLPTALGALDAAATTLAAARPVLALGAPARLVDRVTALAGRMRLAAVDGTRVV